MWLRTRYYAPNIERSWYDDADDFVDLALKRGDFRQEVFLGGGNDFMYVTSGQPYGVYDGGLGNDTISYSRWGSGVTANLLTGVGQGNAKLRGIENVNGTRFDDHLEGDDGANKIEAGDGNNVVYGHSGADRLICGSGNDFIDSGNDNDADRIEAGSGDDAIYIGAWDTALGGPGRDAFHFTIERSGEIWLPDFQDGADSLYAVCNLEDGMNVRTFQSGRPGVYTIVYELLPHAGDEYPASGTFTAHIGS